MSSRNSQLNSRRNSVRTSINAPATPGSNAFTTPTRLSRAPSQEGRRPYSYFPAVSGKLLVSGPIGAVADPPKVYIFLDSENLRAPDSRAANTKSHGRRSLNLAKSGRRSSSGDRSYSVSLLAALFALCLCLPSRTTRYSIPASM